MKIAIIGTDFVKQTFEVHAADGSSRIVVRKASRRAQAMPFVAKPTP